ncbi:MAG TPA: OsmC family protein [Zoogloea sp.]|uniref:OsmC family protein n=1 Tax=Zoogloea sp. TaxID=49181 RepID=UPI002BBC33A0|nr:OsmC family protein [Zoogloea sp.]HMV17257.1 OsmC family protein [Rhodocyclaceae bacterium]HMV62597.1 OsmC family protein [Rhodocyclaceae bacterium]HMZ75724.1 OsmC family protein [Rhodocyclaceae bacterium]HNB64453.1 OsmC family protein [Rhodocyclaceae bacterium]HNC78770.1 OsmC family protein [Rhodocyclaceae bacterium]
MTITVTRDTSGPMRHIVSVGRHRLTVDEPPDVGGEDAGPNPHDLYDAALGACKALTLVWYARRKGIPLDAVEIEVERDASHERDGHYRLSTRLTLGGPLDEAQRAQLLAVAARCPVHKLMTQVSTEIETTLKNG